MGTATENTAAMSAIYRIGSDEKSLTADDRASTVSDYTFISKGTWSINSRFALKIFRLRHARVHYRSMMLRQ